MKKTDSSEGKRNRKTQTLSALLSASALGLFLEGCGAGGGDAPVAAALLLTATSVPEAHIGDTGSDTVSYANSESPVVVSLSANIGTRGDAQGDTFENIENLIGSDYDDTLTGDAGDNTFEGGKGGDAFYGGAGTDTASYANSESPVVVSLSANIGTRGDAQGDTFENIENLIGSDYDDTLTGDAGDNTFEGGKGGDAFYGGAGTDTASYANAGSYVHVFLIASEGTNMGDAAGDTFAHIENIIGSDYDDTLTGDAGDNTFEGGKGGDAFYGGSRHRHRELRERW